MRMLSLLLLLLPLCSATPCQPPTPNRTPLVIGALLPSTPVDGRSLLNSSLMPAVELALKHLGGQGCILGAYELQVETRDTQCKASIGTKAFFDMMDNYNRTANKKVALFGDACTVVNEPIAMTAKYWHIVQVSYAETHPKFSGADSSTMYPTFYRMVPADRSLHDARFRFLARYNWTRVGTVKQSDQSKYALPHETFTTNLEQKQNIKVVHTAEISSQKLNIGAAVRGLKAHDARIIIGDMNASMAIRVLCEAFHHGMFGPNYVWILPGFHRRFWWLHEQKETNCSMEQLARVLEDHFIMEFAVVRPDKHVRAVSNFTAAEYMKQYMELCSSRGGGLSTRCDIENPWHAYVYDGLWTLAVALNQVASQSSIDTSDAGIVQLAVQLQSALNSSLFEGVTGKVRFADNERLGQIRIAQFKNGTYYSVGYFDAAEDSFELNEHLLNRGWRAPLDATVEHRVRQYISFELYVTMCTLAVIGMVLALVFLAINLHFRRHKFIRMSSPNMNNMIIVGSILTYLSVVLLGVDTRFVSSSGYTAFCYAKIWVLSLGFTLAFGSMFSKTWRVHSIFTNIKLNKKAIKDYKLFLLVGVLLLIDCTVLVVWAAVAPMSTNITRLASEKDTVHNRVIIPELEQCYSKHSLVFQAILYSFKGLLMVLGCFLAWETRKVNVPALNDSKYIGMSVYNVVLMCVLGLSLAFILQDRVTEAYLIICTFIIFCTTLTLCLVFVPKIFELIRNPKGTERRYKHGMMKVVNNVGNFNRNNSITSLNSEKDRLVRLEQDNQVWTSYLVDKTREVVELTAKLKEHGEDFDEDSAYRSSEADDFGGVYIGPPLAEPETERPQLHQPTDNPQAVASTSPNLVEVTEKTRLLQNARDDGQIMSKLRSTLATRHSCDLPTEGVTSTTAADSISEPGSRPSSFYQSTSELVSSDVLPLQSVGNSRTETAESISSELSSLEDFFSTVSSLDSSALASISSPWTTESLLPRDSSSDWDDGERKVSSRKNALTALYIPGARLLPQTPTKKRWFRFRRDSQTLSHHESEEEERTDEAAKMRKRWEKNRQANCPFIIGTKDFENYANFMRSDSC